jgi:phosphoribosylanthranilate isomerase
MTKIKICGLSRSVDITEVNEVLPDYIGFVFAKSRRQVCEVTAKELKAKLNSGIQAVGVFVNEDPELIIRLCSLGIIDIIQLHGDEEYDYIGKLKARVSNPIIKAVRVRRSEDIRRANEYDCDYLLLDAYNAAQYGGSGEAFDWSLITKVNKPFFLAGGIDKNNVLQAITQTFPYAIDVSSGVETSGFKDKDKINDIVTIVRSVR